MIAYAPEYCRHGTINCFMSYLETMVTEDRRVDVIVVNILVHHINALPKPQKLHPSSNYSFVDYQKSSYAASLRSLFAYATDNGIQLLWLTGPR